MSSDNYYIVRPFNDGWAAVMGFASDPDEPAPSATDAWFPTRQAAMDHALFEYSEYGLWA